VKSHSFDIVLYAVCLVFAACLPLHAANVEWNQKGTAWNNPANWSTGKAPGPDDVAVFNSKGGEITNQPVVSGTVRVGGIVFGGGVSKERLALPILMHVGSFGEVNPDSPVAWSIKGQGKIILGKNGIVFTPSWVGWWTNCAIYPAVEVAKDQSWIIGNGAGGLIPTSQTSNTIRQWGCFLSRGIYVWDSTYPGNVVLFGALSGSGGICKQNTGRVICLGNRSPTFSGGTTVNGGQVAWGPAGLTATQECFFGTGPIVLDGGMFAFLPVHREGARLMNKIQVGPHNGEVEELTFGSIHVSSPIELRGALRGACDLGWSKERTEIIFDGPLTVYQGAAASPGFEAFVKGSKNSLLFAGPITDGPGGAGNPLILRGHWAPVRLQNPTNSYRGPTVVSGATLMEGSSNRHPTARVAPQSRLGTGDLIVEPCGSIHLSKPTNLAAGARVTVQSNAAGMGIVEVGYNGVPAITADSPGVLAIENDGFDALTDLSTLGNGRMLLGAMNYGVFTGRRLAPGADHVYRLGGGGSPGAYVRRNGPLTAVVGRPMDNTGLSDGAGGVLILEHGVLQGAAGVEVGAMGFNGNASVLLKGANTFSGPLTVQGSLTLYRASGGLLEGAAQTQAGQSPFGGPRGPVRLKQGTLRLTGVPGGQPVTKGTLSFGGRDTIALNAVKNGPGPSVLTFASLAREGRAVLTIEPMQNRLGDTEKLLIADWKENRDLVPPYLLRAPSVYGSADQHVDFLSYDAAGGRGFRLFESYAANLLQAKEHDVVNTGAVALAGGTHTVRALKTSGDITGGGLLQVTGGGVILAGNVETDIDFGGAEGVFYIYNPKGQYMPLWTCKGKVSGRNGITVAGGQNVPDGCLAMSLPNTRNDLKGAVTVNGGCLYAVLDKKENGAFVAGSLGDLNNEIVLNGGGLTPIVQENTRPVLAPSRTLRLGPGGGCFGSIRDDGYDDRGGVVIHSRITGAGSLTGHCSIANGANDYSGGTAIIFGDCQVLANGKLGTGPVMVHAGLLTLQGDKNIDPGARLTLSRWGNALFESHKPVIGSLDGSGTVFLGAYEQPPSTVNLNTTLTLGADNTDSTFYGTIRQIGEKAGDRGGLGAITKTGKGTFTLYGGHTYTGATTVEQGTLILKGSVAGDAVVKKGATFVLKGKVAGKVTVDDGAIFKNER
jgi:autotransporter-associated beta strand protein